MRRILAAILILVLLLIVLTACSYSRFQVKVTAVASVKPTITADLNSVARGVSSLISGNVRAAISEVVTGIEVDVELSLDNSGPMPVYLPGMKHVVYLGEMQDDAVDRAPANPAVWSMPGSSRSVHVKVFIPIEEIPELALEALLNGGAVEVSVDTIINLAGVSFARSASARGDVLEAVRNRLGR